MDKSDVHQLIDTWRTHNTINLLLISAIPAKGFSAVPAGSKGRTVAEQLEHMNRIRRGWIYYHRTGKRISSSSVKTADISRVSLKKIFSASGKEFEQFLADLSAGKAKLRAFHKNPFRFTGYLISHESHHRGSILLALKQNGMRLPDKTALNGLWLSWMW